MSHLNNIPLCSSDYVPPFLTFKHKTFCTECIWIFCMILTTNNEYFSTQHYHNDFKTENYVVYCAVRVEASDVIQVNISF